jgi:hypothetical protein
MGTIRISPGVFRLLNTVQAKGNKKIKVTRSRKPYIRTRPKTWIALLPVISDPVCILVNS